MCAYEKKRGSAFVKLTLGQELLLHRQVINAYKMNQGMNMYMDTCMKYIFRGFLISGKQTR